MVITLPLKIPTYKTITSNWMHPDNVWHNNNPNNPITLCNVDPSIHPPQADHLPIITMLNLPILRARAFPTHNMHNADFNTINKKLQAPLAD